jgi:hypothetical protein
MTFNPNVPQPSDFLSISQGNLLTNNQALDTSFAVDHSGFSATSNNGQHKQVTLYQVEADPTLSFPASMVYSKNIGSTPNRTTNLYYSTQPETGSASIYQLTGLSINTFANSGAGGGNGNYIVTPWGITILWGSTSAMVQNITVNLPISLSNTTYSLQLTVIGNSYTVQEVSKSVNSFSAKIGSSSGSATEWFIFGNS